MTRRREYYIGDRRRRRSGRRLLGVLVLVGGAIAAVGGVAAMGGLPAISLPGQSAGPVAIATGAATGDPTASSLATVGPTGSPVASPLGASQPPATPPPPPPPAPCRPPVNVGVARVISHGDFKQKVVALTFDDGTNPENTKQILRILQHEKVNATFFPTGVAMERFSDVWKAVARANFPIANHTYGHGALADKCFEPQQSALSHAADVFTTLGIPESPYMRPPYELFDDTTKVAASSLGLDAVILWNVDTGDWQGASAATIRRIALTGGKGSIILMHTFPEATAAALPGIIKGFKARGYRFVTIGQILGIDGPVPYPPTP